MTTLTSVPRNSTLRRVVAAALLFVLPSVAHAEEKLKRGPGKDANAALLKERVAAASADRRR